MARRKIAWWLLAVSVAAALLYCGAIIAMNYGFGLTWPH